MQEEQQGPQNRKSQYHKTPSRYRNNHLMARTIFLFILDGLPATTWLFNRGLLEFSQTKSLTNRYKANSHMFGTMLHPMKYQASKIPEELS